MQGSARKHIETIAREKLPVAGPSVGALSSPLGLSFLLECNSFRGRVCQRLGEADTRSGRGVSEAQDLVAFNEGERDRRPAGERFAGRTLVSLSQCWRSQEVVFGS